MGGQDACIQEMIRHGRLRWLSICFNMPTLLTLPKELLLLILSYLPLPVIETIARTHNHQITATCLILLRPLFARRRYIKALKARFGDIEGVQIFDFEIFIQATAKFGISKAEWRRVREPTEEDVVERVEWLDWMFSMDGLEWLRPTGPPSASDRTSEICEPLLSDDAVLSLQDKAQVAGVQIPSSFFHLVQSPDLLHRMPRSIVSSFTIDTHLSIAAVKDASGYTLLFYTDHEYGDKYSLFLSMDGTHCVLNNPEDALDESIGDLSGVGFGEWLAVKVFEQEIHDVIFEDRVVEDTLRDYIHAIYVRRPEELKSGKPTRMEQRMFTIRGGKQVKVWEYDDKSGSWYKTSSVASC